MLKITDLTLPSLLKAYKQNEGDILMYIEMKKGNVVEGLTGTYNDGNTNIEVGAYSGVAIGIFIVFLLVVMGLSIWALVVLIKNGNNMPVWAIVLSWLFFFFSGPILPLILVYSTKGTK
jgi:hypothetical protein